MINVTLDGRENVNLNLMHGLLDLHVDEIVEVFHQPGSSVAPLILLKARGVDAQRHVCVQREGEVDVVASRSSPAF